MPAALPSGPDPNHYDMGDWGVVGAALSGLQNRTQENIENVLRGDMQASTPWGAASQMLFSGLEAALGFPIAFLKGIVESILGAIVGADSIEDLLDLLFGWSYNLPLIGDIVEAITGFVGGGLDELSAFMRELPLIGDLVEAITGGVQGGLSELRNFFANIPNIGEIVQVFTGIVNGTFADLANWVQSIPVLGDIVNIVTNIATSVIQILPIPAQNIIGSIFPGLIGNVPISALTMDQPNMLIVGGFIDATSIATNPDWTWEAVGRTDVGSARTNANGKLKVLRSAHLAVSEGKNVQVSVHTRWMGLVYTGNSPIQLSIRRFRQSGSGYRLLGETTIESLTAPPGFSSQMSIADGNGWVKLSGTYTVPAGVDAVTVRLVVRENATAGSIWFDDGEARHQDSRIQRGWIDGLVEIFRGIADVLGLGFIEDLLGGFNLTDIWSNIIQAIINPLGLIEDLFARFGLQSLVDGIIEALTGIPIVGGFITDVIDELGDLFNTANDAFAFAWDALGGLGDLVQNLLINPAAVLGQIPQTLVSGLSSALSNLASTISGVLGQLQTLASNLLSAPASVIGNLFNTAIDFIGGTIGNLLNGLFSAFGGVLGGGQSASVSGVANRAEEVTNVAYTTQYSTDTLTSFWQETREVPAWLGNLTDDVVFPIHEINGTTTPALNQLILLPIVVQQDRLYPAIKFGMETTTMTNLYVGLYALDFSTGNLSKVLDLGNVKSQLYTGYDLQQILLPEPIGVQRGEVYYVGIIQSGGSASAMHRASGTNNFTTGLWPKFIGNVGGTFPNGLPNTVNESAIISGTKYWAALGENINQLASPDPKPVFLHYNGYTTTFIEKRSGNKNFVSEQGTITIDGSTVDDTSAGSIRTRLRSTNQRIAMRVLDDDGNLFTSQYIWWTAHAASAGLRGNGQGRYVYMNVREASTTHRATDAFPLDSYYIELRTCSTYDEFRTKSGTLRAGTGWVTRNNVRNATYELVAAGNTYSVYRNGLMVVQWVDAGGAYSYNDNFTETGIAVQTRLKLPLIDWVEINDLE